MVVFAKMSVVSKEAEMNEDQLLNELLSIATIADKEEARLEAEALLLDYIGSEEIRSAFREIWRMA